MLGNADLIAFVPTCDLQKSRCFYEDVLGLEFVNEDPFALVFRSHGTMLRIANVSTVDGFKPAPFSILGWRVASAEKAVRAPREKGIEFERFPGMHQTPRGIWQSSGGAKVAWF